MHDLSSNVQARSYAYAMLLITGGRFPQILDLFQHLKIGVSSGCLGETSKF